MDMSRSGAVWNHRAFGNNREARQDYSDHAKSHSDQFELLETCQQLHQTPESTLERFKQFDCSLEMTVSHNFSDLLQVLYRLLM